MSSITITRRSRALQCAEPRVQNAVANLANESFWALVLAGATARDCRASPT